VTGPARPPDPELHLHAAQEGGDAAAALLRRAGCRPTPQRLLVLEALGRGGHFSAEDILEYARARFPSINASTVYRTLDALVDAGIAQRTDLHAGYLHFELTRGHRHHHAVCQVCGAVAHLHDDVLAEMARKLAADTGFELSPDREITLPAVCPDCREAAARA
jgi:Fur family ferric uptake transcriptional regulator